MIRRSFRITAVLLAAVTIAAAQIPRTLSYQGVLTTPAGSPKPDGNYDFTFRLYTVASGGTPVWTEAQSLPVKKGLFSAVLGSSSPIPGTMSFDQQYWLGIQVAPDAELSPRIRFASVPSSFNAIRADSALAVTDSSITGADIAAGQVVRSLNARSDRLVLRGANGASVTTNADTITITASGGGGGVGAIQNTDNSLDISNPAGPTATINLKSPFTMAGSLGVGTATPTYKVDVVGPIRADNSVSNDIVVSTTGGTNSWARYWMITPAQGWVLGTSNAFNGNQFYLYDATFNMTRMSILPNAGEVTFPSPLSNHIHVQTSGGTNSWAQIRVSTASQGWIIGTSRDFNGNQLYFSDVNAGLVRMAIMPDGNVGIGTTVPSTRLDVAGRTRTQSLEITGGGDLVEPFGSPEGEILDAGTVVSVDPAGGGRVIRSTGPYDTRVVGVISGAGDVRPGLTLRQEGVLDGEHLVAIAGRVYVKGDAEGGPIRPGDLLTTSTVPGHAMRAGDRERARGAVIGKALTSLERGSGLVLVLVNIQ